MPVAATDFNGSYIRGLISQGTYGEPNAKGNGSWGIAKKKRIVFKNLKGDSDISFFVL